MKKVLIYTSIIILITIVVCVVVVEQSIVRVQLPHGAVLHVWPAHNNHHANGAVILCPGGGYHHQSKWHEGYWWFPFFHRQGFTVAMLEYRLPNRNHEAPMVTIIHYTQIIKEQKQFHMRLLWLMEPKLSCS